MKDIKILGAIAVIFLVVAIGVVFYISKQNSDSVANNDDEETMNESMQDDATEPEDDSLDEEAMEDTQEETNSDTTVNDLFADTRNAQRSSDVLQILNAVTQYLSNDGNSIKDFGGILDCSIRQTIIGGGQGEGFVNLTKFLVPDYIVAIPQDPSVGSDFDSGYTICAEQDGKVTINAPYVEGEGEIKVTR
ncbi:hypothetical protein KC678_00295 [Candidatus Dojkabacteria bacterium]|uniref:Uncharacterized protein n=1 Tax=Candidatus Dojkabacteria bacterium TaxID=2099670 RepID=A0A955L0X5_9BACT|nr:hypothetical protein [Candidatus Dojkabacteria bacterium]